ncbi:hypothetical protein [Deinococcus petrolearius]|uniref:Uncharacterized protein n=1 Tax=Deinococcus petrolearius TaxID=1751295 RepID=A0ABW1DFG9_9DEIO
MPGTRRDRAAAPALASRLAAAAQPAPIPLNPSPTLGVGRSLGYPTDAEVQAGRGDLLGRVLGERYPSGGGERAEPDFNPHGNSPFYRRVNAQTPDAAPQTAQDGPPTLPLPPQVARGLAAPPEPAQGLPPKGPEWERLHDPLPILPPLAQIATTLVQEAIATHGEASMTVGVAYRARRVAHVLLHGREMPWQEDGR